MESLDFMAAATYFCGFTLIGWLVYTLWMDDDRKAVEHD